jgi:hypothetical protein
MAGGFVFPEWLNANSVRAYPLSETATRLDEMEYIKIPDSLIVSASITIHPNFASYTFFVSKINITSQSAQVTISCQDALGANGGILCTVTGKVSDGINQVFEIVGSGNLSSITGNITLGDIQQASSEAVGAFTFTAASAPFEPTIVYVSLPSLNYVQAYNGSELVGTFDDLLLLRAGENIRLTYTNNNTIRIDAISGLNNPEDCSGKAPSPPCIKTINGIPPDSNGNFVINGGECIDIAPGVSSITVSDTCSKSCCGCDELEGLINSLSLLETQYQSLRDQINTIQTQQSQMISNLVSNIAG